MPSINSNNQISSAAFNLAASTLNLAAKGGKIDAPTVANLKSVIDGLAGLASNANTKGATGQPPMSSLFGTGAFDQQKNADKAKAQAAALGVGDSLGSILAFVGAACVKSINNLLSQLKDAAKQLDASTSSGSPTAAQNQKIQELTFNLQQIQQTLNRVNEAVTNLSKSQTDAQKATTQNLSV